MSAKQKQKTISKVYPAQLMSFQNQIIIYSPLQHWAEQHSSTSITDLIQIDGEKKPYFLNTNNNTIILQNEQTIMSLRLVDQYNQKLCKNYQHDCSLISVTIKFNDDYFINLDETGSLNLLNLDNISQNPQSFKQISTKTSLQGDTNKRIQTSIDLNSLNKNHKNGFDFSDFVLYEEQIFTIHNFKNQQQSYSMIYKTIIEGSQCFTTSLRSYLPSNVKKLLVEGNSIWAYGSDNLLLVDNRSESIVLRLNNIPETQISYVEKSQGSSSQIYVSRDSSILLQDARKPQEIVQVVVNSEHKIDSFVKIIEDDKQIFCISSALDGQIQFYQR